MAGRTTHFSLPPLGGSGASGPAGPVGPVGPVGPEGPAGVDGVDGASAYEVAVAGGFTGTEEEWLASLVGPSGPVGAQGAPGPQGIQGEPGIQGPTGLGMQFKGEVDTEADLPATGNTQGDFWVVNDPLNPNHAWVWDEATGTWVDAGPIQGIQGVQGPQGTQGVQGPAGPSAVSTDAGNISKLGSDNLIFTPATDVSGFVKKTGDTMTGQLGFGDVATTPLRFGSAVTGNYNLTMLASEGGMRWQFNSNPIIDFTKDEVQAKKPVMLVADPTVDLEAATKKYVDGKFSGAGYVLPIASSTVLGGVFIGAGLSISASGVLSSAAAPLLPATTTALGGVKVGTGLTVTADGTLAAAATALTPATATVLGGIKVGAGLAVTADGTLSAAGAVANSVNGSVAGMTLWVGTQAQFNAIATKDPLTVYNVTA